MPLADLYPSLAVDLPYHDRAPKRASASGAYARGGKGTPVYMAHSYPTKVPPEAIEPLIKHFTRPGDVICDPFSGSGMTGVAAIRSGRNAFLNDLSPLAAHLSWNVTHPCRGGDLRAAASSILAQDADRFKEWYRAVCGKCTGEARLEWLLWGETVKCPACGAPVRLWDAAFDRMAGTMPAKIPCGSCGTDFSKGQAELLESAPVWASVSCERCGRSERPALHSDARAATRHEFSPVKDWYPTTSIDSTREMYIRSALHLRGVKSIDDFYTRRNLRALARLWLRILEWPDMRVRQALAFAFTNTAWHGTRMRRFNARGGQRPLTGTLYIPQMSVEVNVATVFRHKIEQLVRFYDSEPPPGGRVSIRVGSATLLPEIADGSIDYVFTDPPFGSNIFYADCNLIAESWMKELTPTPEEAVVNRSLRPQAGGKSVSDYCHLMTAAFSEIARILKPGAWATVVFQNTDPAVWDALHSAVADAGLTFERASTLDKTQQSHKGYKGRSGVEDVAAFDMVLNLRKVATRGRLTSPKAVESGRVQDAVRLIHTHLVALPQVGLSSDADRKRTLPYLYSLLLRAHFNGDIGLHERGYARVRDLCGSAFHVDSLGRWHIERPAASVAGRAAPSRRR